MDMDKKPKNTPPAPGGEQSAGCGTSVGNAFDIWLQRHLHRLYDDVMREPLPPELMQLIEADRDRRQV